MKIIISLITVMFFWVGLANAGHTVYKSESYQKLAVYVTEIYQVSKEETLDSVTAKFIWRNTYAPRGYDEFKQGIVELNPWLLKRALHDKDQLEIRYWRKYERLSKDRRAFITF